MTMFEDYLGKGEKMNQNITSKVMSIANQTAMIYGEVTFKNVLKILNDNPPTNISIERFAAMVANQYKTIVP